MAATRERFECPHCGAMFHSGRLACPECGSDAETGWQHSEEIDYMSVEIPDAMPAKSVNTLPRSLIVFAALATAIAMLILALR